MSANARQTLPARVARRLAFDAFSEKFKLELGMFGPAAAGRREIWVERNWPVFLDRARAILADILPDILALTYHDESAARRRLDACDPKSSVQASIAAVAVSIACHSNALGDRIAALFEEPAPPPVLEPPEMPACTRS